MFDKLRPRSVYDVMAAIACFGVLAGGTAYASHELINSSDVVDESLTGADVKGKYGTSSTPAVNGTLGTQDIGGQQANPLNGTPFIDGSLTQWDIKNGTLGSDDVANNSLTGADIDEGSLVGGPGSPSGVAGGDLTGSYPNPLIRSNAVGSNEILDKSIGAADLKDTVYAEDSEVVAAGGVPVDVRAVCPDGGIALYGGAYWQYPSGSLSRVTNLGNSILANGTNRGNAEQFIHVFAYCLPP